MTTTRRAALTALAGVSALAIPKTARALSSGHGDTELFALQDAIEAADRNHEAALGALSLAESAAIAARPSSIRACAWDASGRNSQDSALLAELPAIPDW
jgi:hypothetical protein